MSSTITELSYWFSGIVEPLKSEKLDEDVSVDIVIIGGCIAGLTTGYILSKSGKNVAVIEDGFIGSGETGHTTAHITNALDDRYFNLEKIFGEDGARLAADSHTKAINFIESLVKDEKIDCDFEKLDGYLFLDSKDSKETLYKEYYATQRSGIITELIETSPVNTFSMGPCLKFTQQAQFHPLKYLKKLSELILSHNGKIYTETHVDKVSKNSVRTSGGNIIKAKKIVIATNAPIVDSVSKIYEKQISYRTYAIGVKVKKGIIPKELYWDTGDNNSKNTIKPYHYIRTQKLENKDQVKKNKDNTNYGDESQSNITNINDDYELLIVGGEDNKTGNENDIEERFTRLLEWTKQRFPFEGDPLYKWSGQVLEPIDSLAFIGANPVTTNNKKEYENEIDNIFLQLVILVTG